MEMHLQFGSGMMAHCKHLIEAWAGGSVVLSPRDLDAAQIVRFSGDVRKAGGEVLIDPQFYFPHSDHNRLTSHSFWPTDYDTSLFWIGAQATKLVENLVALNDSAGSSRLILPGLLASKVNDDWLAVQQAIITESVSSAASAIRLATVALSADAIINSDQIELLVEASETWNVSGYYVVPTPPNGEYLVQNPMWLANLLDLLAGLKLQRREVILGYCNHQLLLASACKVDAVCSGTWKNVRSFSEDRFQAAEEDDRRRAKWYYCPQAFSEFKIPFLDIAWQHGVLRDLAPPTEFDGGYARSLFLGTQPSNVNFSEQASFRHYLHALHRHAELTNFPQFDESIDYHMRVLDDAEAILHNMHSIGVKGQDRDFLECIDVSRAALGVLQATRGPLLRRLWPTI